MHSPFAYNRTERHRNRHCKKEKENCTDRKAHAMLFHGQIGIVHVYKHIPYPLALSHSLYVLLAVLFLLGQDPSYRWLSILPPIHPSSSLFSSLFYFVRRMSRPTPFLTKRTVWPKFDFYLSVCLSISIHLSPQLLNPSHVVHNYSSLCSFLPPFLYLLIPFFLSRQHDRHIHHQGPPHNLLLPSTIPAWSYLPPHHSTEWRKASHGQ